jgi:hypothetical protein
MPSDMSPMLLEAERPTDGAVIAGCQRMHDGRWLWGGSLPPTKRQGDVRDVAGLRLPRDPW